jgi:hypothetical protein
MKLIFVRLFCFLLYCFSFHGILLVDKSFSEELRVSNTNSEDVFVLNLPSGETGNVLVYLMSFGDMVDQYLVTLRREDDNKRIGALLSDRHGRVIFRKVPVGSYRVEVSRRIREDGELSTVQVGDIRLSPTKRRPREDL